MADEADRAADMTDAYLSRAIAAARQPVPRGQPGICDDCGEDWPRLVGGACAPCRDERAENMIYGRSPR